jgi:Zn-dependent protease with chaperone function
VIGIIIGALFSALHVIRFYALAFTLIQMPVSLYFGHYRILKFPASQILRFWLPKVIIANLLIFSIWFGNFYTTSFVTLLLFIETFYKRQNDLQKIYALVIKKIKR